VSNKKNKNLLYTIVFVVIALVGVSYYLSTSTDQSKTDNGKTSPSTSTSDQNTTQDDNSSDESKKDGINYYGKIYYIKKTDGTYQIFSKENDSDEKLLYTDHDEQEKIKFAKSMTNSAKFLALISSTNQTFGGSLYLISADGSGNKEKIIDEFISPQPPIISPDEEKIAYVLFSNAEMEYGFSLYVMGLNGENKVKIDTNATMISNSAFDQNAKSLAYQKGNEIVISDIDGKVKEVIYTIDQNEVLNSINWSNQNKILVALSSSDQDKSKIITIDSSNKDTQTVYESDDNLIDPIWIDSELDQIAFINTASNSLEIIDLNNNKKSITEASNIIKWLK